LAEHNLCAPLAKLHQCRRADVHEMRTLERQPRPQTGRNFEPSTVIG